MRKDSPTRELIELAIDVVQQFGCEGKYWYWHGGLSTLETAHGILYQRKIIKNFNRVRHSEIKRYYKTNK